MTRQGRDDRNSQQSFVRSSHPVCICVPEGICRPGWHETRELYAQSQDLYAEKRESETSGVPKNLRRGGLEYRNNIDLRWRRKNFAIFCLISELFSPFFYSSWGGLETRKPPPSVRWWAKQTSEGAWSHPTSWAKGWRLSCAWKALYPLFIDYVVCYC